MFNTSAHMFSYHFYIRFQVSKQTIMFDTYKRLLKQS